MAYGQNYDDAGDYGGPDQRDNPYEGYDAQHPPPGMIFDPSTNTFISAFNEPQIPGTANGPGITPPPPTTGGAMDDAAILAQIAQWAGMTGADPSLKNDPNYWLGAIKSRGGLNASNLQYWQDASGGPKAFFNNPNREGGGNNAGPKIDNGSINAGDWFSSNAPSPASYSQLTRPDYLSQPYTPKQFTEQFNAPTMEDLKNDPGYQAGADLTQKGLERSAAAKGSILSGGFVGSALPRALNDYAGQAYQNLFGRSYDTYNQKYQQFRDAQNADLTARGLNENTFQTDLGNNLNTYKTRYQAYSDAINNNFNLAQLGLNATTAGSPGTPL